MTDYMIVGRVFSLLGLLGICAFYFPIVVTSLPLWIWALCGQVWAWGSLLGAAPRLRASWLVIAIGASMNHLVVAVNAGMPVVGDPNAHDAWHHAATEATRLPWLADWIYWSVAWSSPGDVLVVTGMIWGMVVSYAGPTSEPT